MFKKRFIIPETAAFRSQLGQVYCLPLWGDTAARPPALGMPARHSVAGHLSRASLEL